MSHWIVVALNVADVPEYHYGPYASSVEAEKALQERGWVNYELHFRALSIWVFIYTARIKKLEKRPPRSVQRSKKDLPHQ